MGLMLSPNMRWTLRLSNSSERPQPLARFDACLNGSNPGSVSPPPPLQSFKGRHETGCGDAASELFPTEIRLRANGICNTLGRAATVVSPFVVGSLMVDYGVAGVIWLMIGLLVIQIIVVAAWGVEPRARALEDVAVAKA